MSQVNLIFPHQLHHQSLLINNEFEVYLVEEHLYFSQYKFHKQKIAFHRASMKAYQSYLEQQSKKVHYIEAHQEIADIRKLIPYLHKVGVKGIHYLDAVDYYLDLRLKDGITKYKIESTIYPSQLFINYTEDLQAFFKPTKKSYFQTTWYKQQRIKRQILVDSANNPIGGKWSFDDENRKKYPRGKTPPPIQFPDNTDYHTEAVGYVKKYFSDNHGSLSKQPLYPIDRASALEWLQQFLLYRFHEFGTYEDAIVKEHIILNHSVLTPMLNVGLISSQEILNACIIYADKNDIPINSLEGFVRQIIGWREFIRGIYQARGREQRTKNYWNFSRKIPKSFYDGTTGIEPIDDTIKKILKTGYCHHIERLMIIGNFMVLCEYDPDEVYRWFMELFIDAYDWVMVPNVYGMSQFADGGLLATKPYISGSNYIKKMSNYKKGEWQATWEALFWRFMSVHRDFFLSNPRLGMLIRMFDKKSSEDQAKLIDTAEAYLSTL